MKKILKLLILLISIFLIISGLGNVLYGYESTYRLSVGTCSLIVGGILIYIYKKYN